VICVVIRRYIGEIHVLESINIQQPYVCQYATNSCEMHEAFSFAATEVIIS